MVNTHSTQKDLKLFENDRPGEPSGSPLDILYVSGQLESESASKPSKRVSFREFKKNDTRWHTLGFKTWAEKSQSFAFGYQTMSRITGDYVEGIGYFRPRWSKVYQGQIYHDIKLFGQSLQREAGCSYDFDKDRISIEKDRVFFVTLTVQHSVTGSYPSMRKCVEDLRAAWSLVRNWIKRKVSSCSWRYLRVMEPGETNYYPHFHMIVVGAVPEDIDELLKRWVAACNKIGNKASMKGQNIRRPDRDIDSVVAYIMKYISKSFREDYLDDDLPWWRWMELACRMRIRVFSSDYHTSRFRYEMMEKEDPLKMLKDIVVGSGGIKVFDRRDMQLKIDEKQQGEENPHPPEQHPILSTAPAVGGGAKPGGNATPARSVPDLVSGRGRRVLGAI